jgi:hypothetical protein
MLDALAEKYNGTADYGTEFVKPLAQVKSAFVWSGGLDTQPRDEEYKDAPEEEFLTDFINENDLSDALGPIGS